MTDVVKPDVEMKDAEEIVDSSLNESDLLVKEIEQSFTSLAKAADLFDNRYISKVFRELGTLRRKLMKHSEVLPKVISELYEDDHPSRAYLLKFIGSPAVHSERKESTGPVLPEVDLYVHLLVQIFLLDLQKLDQLNELNSYIIQLMKSYNRRSLDFLQAKIWFYISRTNELRDDLLSVRADLLAGLRTATLRHDTETTASIITLLLRNYLLTHDVQQGSNLIEKTEFPTNAGNSLVARYYYYLAKLNAIQLNYSGANEYVIAAIRKTPQTNLANGFIQAATKLSIVIELLMGDIPELQTFKKHTAKFEVFEPYFYVTKAVKLGDLKMFGEVLNKYENVFRKDDNLTLISRLRQNVIKTGIRIISLSYSKISLKDICIKLHLDSEELTEYIVSKAIRDGVIDATINHSKGYMQSKELLDIYSTKLPQNEFNQRIQFCLSLYNDSVKSMRYPNDNTKQKQEAESNQDRDDEFDLIRAIEEGDLDDYMDSP